MKRFFWLTAVLCLLLCACGKETPQPTVPETSAPAVTEPMTEATEPVTVPAPSVVITKDPTDETLERGGKTWFVAHADGATSVTWEFTAPDGTCYSVSDTVEKNPGLFLDVSKGDTIALEKAPLSLNGWTVQARFDGPGGSATTAAARITVKQNVGAYDAILTRYKAAQEARLAGDNSWAAQDVSEMLFYAAHVGYALRDLDGNGTEELIIAGIGYDIPEEPYVFDIYTLENGAPVNVCRSWARSRLFLMQDGKIYNEGSGGAAYSNFSVMQIVGAELRFLDGLYTTDTAQDGSQIPFTYYYTTSNQFGHPEESGNDNQMDEKIAQTFLDRWRASISLPELSYIA